ncbi:MAG: AI-2E family transporter [Paracoccaceae bacterium]
MAVPVRQQLTLWGLAALVLALMLYALGNVLAPFIMGGVIAYFLDPLADRLERLGLSRGLSVAIISIVMALAVVAAVVLVIPTLARQIDGLIEIAPALLADGRDWVLARFPQLGDESSTIRQQLAQVFEGLEERAGQVAQTVLASLGGLLNVALLFVIVPVVSVYLLLDWDRMVARVDALLPREHAPTIRRLFGEIDRTLAGFIRGQATVCLILGAYYAIALMLAGLNFGLVVGFIAGILTFIPYVGALIGGGLAIGLALAQEWGNWLYIVLIYAIFQSGQFVEGNVLTPKLVGESVGLHPVWLLLALTVFGALFGFVGLLIAVPVAAVIGVLARFATQQYLASPLYRGSPE